MTAAALPLVVVHGPQAFEHSVREQLEASAGCPAQWLWCETRPLAQAGDDRIRVFVDAALQLGPSWLQRLLLGLAALPPRSVLTTLGNQVMALQPVLAGTSGPVLDPGQMDRACWLLASRSLLPIDSRFDSGLSACAADAAEDSPHFLSCMQYSHDPQQALQPAMLPADPRERTAEPLFAGLAESLQGLPATARLEPVGLDDRPVVLHLLHGWGGGAQRWVLDLAASDPDRHHLLLRASGTPGRQQHGETLVLVNAREPEIELRRIRLEPAITSLAEHHAHYGQVLRTLCAEFAVAQLWVSSLIGHALDALRTGLPLRWIGHDYFPFWPVLHVDFGDPARRFDLDELRVDLESGSAPLVSEPAETWWHKRESLLQTLVEARAEIVVPSHSVQHNLRRVAPALAQCPMRTISHGLGLALTPLPAPPPRPRPRVLVLGRINGGKGETLLAAALPQLSEFCEVYLLGCGVAGKRFFGWPDVHLELDYEPGQLDAKVHQIAPDLGLLPRTVAETFSYVLSELRALCLPVLGTALGSLVERIRHGEDGWLCAPDADDLVHQVRELCAQPQSLLDMRGRLAQLPVGDLAQMCAQYLPLLPLQRCPLTAPTLATLETLALADVIGHRVRLQLDHQQALGQLGAATAESQRRGEWGQSLNRELLERTRWAQALLAERDQLEATRQSLALELDAAREHAAQSLELQQQFKLLSEQSAQELQRVGEELRLTRGYLAQADIDCQRARGRVEELERSRSWRLTAPLRWLVIRLQRLRESLAYRSRSLRQLLRRGRNSLRQRGWKPTLQRLLKGRGAPPELSVNTAPLADPDTPFAPFELPDRGAPRVSVVIPVYNKFAYTEACLRSLQRVVESVAFETIVVDDGSSDGSFEKLQQIGGIVAFRNPQNLGFIGACNKGAELARGEYVFFLNNDTQVQDGFLSELLKVFASRPDAGLVGSKLIYPDGRLQESGGIIFSDGGGWNYGRFEDPQHCHYGFVREADYVSGAAIALPRALFWELGGFDTYYAPAYYEDTDLAFKVRARAGRKVYVAPRSRVVHFEGITSGTDVATGIKRFQVVNQAKFLERWADELKQHPAQGTSILKARNHRVKRRVLVIDACTPMPDQDSGSLRMVNLMKLLLAEGSAVSFFAENRAWHAGYAEALQDLGVEALFHPWMPDAPEFFRERGAEFDLVILSRHYVAVRFLPLVQSHCPQAKIWFDTVDLHYLRERRAAELSGDANALRAAEQTQAQELALMRACDLTLVVSSVERELLAVECPGARVEILSNIHEIPGRRREFSERQDIFFVGGFQHPPNVDAMLWFMREVWPRVHAAEPGLVLHLIGSNTPAEIKALASDQVKVHGFVQDIEPFLDGCRLSIAPLRYGAGVKGKVNMSMSYGCPVVATLVAVEGMHMQPGVEALVAQTPDEFASALLELYRDPQLWLRLSEAGLANVSKHFSLSAAREVLARLM